VASNLSLQRSTLEATPARFYARGHGRGISMIDFERARTVMVDTQVATSSVTDRRLLAVLRRIPRERFVPENVRDLAYLDRDVPLGQGRVLTAPAPFARLIQLAEITPQDKVLDAGAGTGYSTAVLAALSATTIALESDAALARTARSNLDGLGIENAEVVTGEVQAASHAPFDVVVVEGVVASPPPQLLAFLREGGRLVALIETPNGPEVPHLFVRQGGALAGRSGFDPLKPVRTPATDDVFVF
jgi:protein-L-isoaspartate(D-aspartate) O-methyltransferase